jgi:hypothetical protein
VIIITVNGQLGVSDGAEIRVPQKTRVEQNRAKVVSDPT